MTTKITNYLNSLVKNNLGFNLSINKDGTNIFNYNNGYANFEHDIRLTSDSVFYVASVGKQITAYCIQKLINEEKLNKKSFIVDILEFLPNKFKDINVENLLSHTSGIADYLTIFNFADRSCSEFFSVDEVKDVICSSSIQFKANERFQYSNSNYFLLALIFEKITKLTIAEFAKEQVFKPLGMNDTLYNQSGYCLVKHRADSYFIDDAKIKVQNYNFNIVGDGGVWSSLNDMNKWVLHLMENSLVERMAKSSKLNDQSQNFYNNGFFTSKKYNHNIIFHDGFFGCYRAATYYLPDQNISMVVLINNENFNPNELVLKVLELLIGNKSTIKSIDLSDDVKGTYINSNNDIIEVMSVNANLYFSDIYGRSLLVKPLSENSCIATSEDNSHKLIKYDSSYKIEHDGSDFYKITETSLELDSFVGEYLCEKFNSFMKIDKIDGELIAKSYLSLSNKLKAVNKNILTMGSSILVFDFLSDSFIVNTPRAVGSLLYKKINK